MSWIWYLISIPGINTNAHDQLFSSLATPDDTAIPITSTQDSIDWEHFIRGRITLVFSSIFDSYYRSNKLGRRFTSKKWFTAIITSLFDIYQQAWNEFCSATTRKSSTDNISSPKPSRQVLPSSYKSSQTSETIVLKIQKFLRLLDSRWTTVIATYI